jgi:hypothetical protein
MKNSLIILFLSTLFIGFNTQLAAQEGEAAPTVAATDSGGKAKLVIYRDKQFAGSALNFALYINDVKLCKISNNRFIEWEVDPGEVVLNAKRGGIEAFKKKTGITLDAEAGATYYIRCDLQSSLMRTRMEMSEVTKNTADRDMEGMQMDDCQGNMKENLEKRKKKKH